MERRAVTARWMQQLPGSAALFLALAGFALGCGAQRSANDPTELYACSGPADCLAGRACLCHYCQDPAAPRLTCAADAEPSPDVAADAAHGPDAAPGADAKDSQSTPDVAAADSATLDAYSGPCDLSTWKPCSAGYGCYFTPATQAKTCQFHGNLGEGAACDPAKPEACGRSAADDRPLICDAVDKKCYRTCVCSKPADLPCPSKMVCYCLKDGANPWPDSAGICAP